jgi:hypothetical protein
MLGVWIVIHVKLLCHLLAVIKRRQARVKFPIFIAGVYFHILSAVPKVNNEPTNAYSTPKFILRFIDYRWFVSESSGKRSNCPAVFRRTDTHLPLSGEPLVLSFALFIL